MSEQRDRELGRLLLDVEDGIGAAAGDVSEVERAVLVLCARRGLLAQVIERVRAAVDAGEVDREALSTDLATIADTYDATDERLTQVLGHVQHAKLHLGEVGAALAPLASRLEDGRYDGGVAPLSVLLEAI